MDNDGYVNIEDIYIGYRGSNSNTNSLLCHTNAKGCCRSLSNNVPGRGQWFLSNESIVLWNAQVGGYLRNRGAGVVRLYRELFSGPAERGRFHCEIPDAVNVNLTLYANIRECNNNYYYNYFRRHSSSLRCECNNIDSLFCMDLI